MNRQAIRLIELFGHWRDQHLYDLQVAIRHLADKQQLTPQDIRHGQVSTSLFSVDAQGSLTVTRRKTSLKMLLRRYTGLTGSHATTVPPLLRTLRLERERRLRHLLHTAQGNLLRLLDPKEIEALRTLPVLAKGPSTEVANLMNAAITKSPRALEDYPATSLARLLGEDSAQYLLREAQAVLGWERQPRNTALMIPDLALLTLMLAWALDPTDDCGGFDFHAPSLAGVSVRQLLAALQAHLMPGLKGCPDGAFSLVRYLLGRNAPGELNVLGLPQELAWATSVTWVLLSHGVTLMEVLIPGGSEQLSFNDALALPAKVAELEPSEFLSQALAATFIPGLRRWNVANQHIANLALAPSLESAARSFLKQFQAMDAAATALQQIMPDRFDMLHRELKNRGIMPHSRFVLAARRVEQSLLSGAGVSALQAVGTGLAAGKAPAWVPALVRGHDGHLHEPWIRADNMPDVPALFEKAFVQWKDSVGHAAGVMTERLLADLPLPDRLRLEEHPVTLCKLARHASEGSGGEQAHYGFVLYVSTAEGAFYYDLVPAAAWCRIQPDPARNLSAPRTHGAAKTEYDLPFDWAAFASGSLPERKARFTGWLEPLLTFPATPQPHYRVFGNGRLIGRHCQQEMTSTLANLHTLARGTLPGEKAKEVPEAIKVLVPFWSSFEAIQQGFEEGRGWLVALGLLGVGLETISLGAWGRLSALSIRFVTLALRKGGRHAVRLLAPRLRSAARDALESVFPVGADPQATSPVADLGLLLSIRRAHGSLLTHTARQLGTLDDAQRAIAGKPLPPLNRPAIYVRPLEDDTQALVSANGRSTAALAEPKLIDPQTLLPYGPTLDIIDDTGRLGRLPKSLPVTQINGMRYVPDPAPSLPKRWLAWGDETWLECSGRYYRLREASASGPAVLEQAPAPFARPPLSPIGCRLRRTLTPLACTAAGERATAFFTELTSTTEIHDGAVAWFDERKVFLAEDNRYVDSRQLTENRQGSDHVIESLTWDRYRTEITARRIAGNAIFQRIEITTGLVEGVEDRRLLSAVQLTAKDTGKLHLVTCVDEGVFYHGEVQENAETFTLSKAAEGDSPHGEEMTLEEELKFTYNGCWDANRQLRTFGRKGVDAQLKIIEDTLAKGVNIGPTLSRRFQLSTTPAEAALFAKYPRRSFTLQTRELLASDYTYPISSETPADVRSTIATHLNRLTKPATRFNETTVLDPKAINDMRPKGKNIAFLALTYKEGKHPEVYFSVSGGRQRRTEVTLGKELMHSTSASPFIAEDQTRYINCRGEGGSVSTEDLLHLPDLSQPGSLNTGDFNDRRLDSERNILAHITRAGVKTEAVSSAILFTRLPTCDSCTTLITQFREKFPSGSFSVYEGPRPTPAPGASATSSSTV